MRALACLCLSAGLAAGEPALPGQDRAFLARILQPTPDLARPWKTFRMPENLPSATVEVVGVLSPEELRQVNFQGFLVWFREDLRRYWLHRGAAAPAWDSSTRAVSRYGGNPVPEPAPLGGVGF